MPDISLCWNKDCRDRMACYRYRAQASMWQSYMHFNPAPGENRCESFTEILKGDRLNPEAELP